MNKRFSNGCVTVIPIKLGSHLVECKVHRKSTEAEFKFKKGPAWKLHKTRINTAFLTDNLQGGDRSKILTCAIFFFWKERTSQDIGYVLPKYENGQIRRNQRRSDLEKNPPKASVIRWRVTVPYENKVLEELDIWDLQWLIFVLKPHKTSIAVDLVFFNLYLQICIIITTVRLKI